MEINFGFGGKVCRSFLRVNEAILGSLSCNVCSTVLRGVLCDGCMRSSEKRELAYAVLRL